MAATFSEVTLEDMEKFLKRGFRALRPKKGTDRGEVFYDLSLSPHVNIRVWTSIRPSTSSGAGVGEDAIRVQLMSAQGRPLMKGKAPIVKRTQGWRGNLQDKIEETLETYEEKDEYWESRAGGSPVRHDEPQKEEEKKEEVVKETPVPPPQAPPSGGVNRAPATFSKLKDGSWGIRVEGDAQPGDRVQTRRADGRTQWITVDQVVWQGRDRYSQQNVSLCTIVNTRQAAEEEDPPKSS